VHDLPAPYLGSLLIQENADPSAKRDLERWLNRLVPEGDPFYTHDAEGPDDMPSHLKAALTATSLSIPIVDGKLALGTWQGSISGSTASAARGASSWCTSALEDLSRHRRREVGPDEQAVDKRWLMAYNAALGEAATAHALFPVCYEWPANRTAARAQRAAGDQRALVHAQHDLTIHRAPRAERNCVSGASRRRAQRRPARCRLRMQARERGRER
jgi:FAD/FMN-containing dehydrogenase